MHKLRTKPWITAGILKSISIKNRYYSKFLKTKDSTWYKKYKGYRDLLNHLIRKSKKRYYVSYFDKFKNNSKKVWSGINDIIQKQKKRSQEFCLLINGKLTIDQKIIANCFNEYFTTVAQKLIDKMKPAKKHFRDYLKIPNPRSFFIQPITPQEINDLIANLDETKANDSHDIPVKLIKLARHTISLPFSLVANSSFENGIFPGKLKFAKVTPIHKGKSKLELTNYRPISILPIFGKLLEKAMHSRMTNFLDEHKILFKHQFGFQKNKSTTLAILDLYTKLVENIEGKRFSCCIFLDFSKAFDTVNHNILLDKLEHYGIRGIAHAWFKSYLTERKQTVSVNGEMAKDLVINCGVPQGSVLGPLLFLLYINDIYVSSQKLDFHLFADDTSLLFSSKNLQNFEQTVNSELTNISDWLLANKLSLNVSKSNFLIINPHKKKIDKPIVLKIDNENLSKKITLNTLA